MTMSKSTGEYAVLKSKNGHPVPLAGIDVRGSIGDVFSRVTVTQTYENREKKNIEAIYSFPLPHRAVLLDFTVTIDGETRRGTVMKKSKAREVYENAVEQGDSACMLEKLGEGLYSMSVGNLLAGQKVAISFSYAMINIWNGSLLRFFLPSVVAPKYGDPGKAGIEDYQAPVTSLTAKNAWKCVIAVTGVLRNCRISCPTHETERRNTEEAVEFLVNAFADRDFVLEIRTDEAPVPYGALGRDGDGYVAAVAMTPDFGTELKSAPRALDIIIDCSGSMTGVSIEQAREALMEILNRLSDTDSFNVIRFGSSVEAIFEGHRPRTDESVKYASQLLEEMKADMGGTNLEDALRAAYNFKTEESLHDILLITDGEVYENNSFYDEAIQSGCRIFTVGVGTAVSEGLLRKLSEVTAGMPEFVTPNEDMSEKIVRHFQRMCLPVMDSEIVWPAKPDWVWPEKNLHLFHGDTAVFFARFPEKPSGKTELRAHSGEKIWSWSASIPESGDETPCSDLARMAVRRKISGRNDDEAQDLAVSYRLVTSQTNYILVKENEDRENIDLPEMRVVPQMTPRGFMGGMMAAAACCMSSAPSSGFMGAASGGMMNFMGMAMSRAAGSMAGMMNGKTSVPPAADACESPCDEGADGTGPLHDFADILAGMELAAVKKLFGEKTVAALKDAGLPEDIADTLEDLTARGIAERILFVLFLRRLWAECQNVLGNTPAAEFISRSYSRLTAAEKGLLPPDLQTELDNLFSEF